MKKIWLAELIWAEIGNFLATAAEFCETGRGMKTTQFFLGVAVMLLLAVPVGTWAAGSKKKPSVKEVMKEQIKGDFAPVKKACKGTATPQELKAMVEAFRVMAEDVPVRGSLDSWKRRAGELLAAAEEVEKTPADAKARERLEHAVECRGCHNEHKPKK